MDYEKKYKEALERASKLRVQNPFDTVSQMMEYVFPEFKESEDEQHRKWILEYLYDGLRKADEQFKPQFASAIGWLEKQDGQKHTDKVEPRFHKGDWISNGRYTKLIVGINSDCPYYMFNDGTSERIKDIDKKYHLWSIADAKDGDVLYSLDSNRPFIYKVRNAYEQAAAYCGLNIYGKFFVWDTKDCVITLNNYVPATKEQRDQLEKAMADAGYTFDFDKKELKKIEDEEYHGEDYGIDSLFHAQRILEKTLGKVDGYQTDDGILSHKCAITAVKKLYEQKPAWSEEDESKVEDIVYFLNTAKTHYASTEAIDDCIAWLKSLKQRI